MSSNKVNSNMQDIHQQLAEISAKLETLNQSAEVYISNQDYQKVNELKEEQSGLYGQLREIQLILKFYQPKDHEKELYQEAIRKLSEFGG